MLVLHLSAAELPQLYLRVPSTAVFELWYDRLRSYERRRSFKEFDRRLVGHGGPAVQMG